MINAVFTASVVRKDKGIYVAHAEQFPITAEPASTVRGAVKKLKTVVLLHLRQAAKAGTLGPLLDDAGYPSQLLGLKNFTLEANILGSATVSVPLDSQRSRWNRTRRRAVRKGNSDAVV